MGLVALLRQIHGPSLGSPYDLFVTYLTQNEEKMSELKIRGRFCVRLCSSFAMRSRPALSSRKPGRH